MLPRVETVRLSKSARRVAVVIVLSAAGRILLAWALGLGVDESYEVVMARTPSLSYFDHPPLSFWLAGTMARIAATEQRVVLRLPFIALFAASTALMYGLTRQLYGERAGWWAALLLNLAPVFSLSTGGWILPDGPLDCALLATALCLTRTLALDGADGSSANRTPLRGWVAAGASTGLALLSKYHGAFLIVGTLAFLSTRRDARRWLRRPEPYVAALIALAMASPVVVWNARHGFASLRFQAGRATSHGVHPAALAQNLAGQLGYLFPWIGIPLLWELVRGWQVGPRDAARWLLVCLASGPIVLFTVTSLGGNPGLPHWPAPGYLLLFPLLGDRLARIEARGPAERRRIRRFGVAAASVFIALTAIAAGAVVTGWPARVAPSVFRRGDPTIEAVDWSSLSSALAREGMLSPDEPIVTTHWIDGAKAGYALGPAHEVFCLSDDPRGFQFTAPPGHLFGRDAIVLVRANRRDGLRRVLLYFTAIDTLGSLPILRAGQVVLEIAVYRGRGARVRAAN